MKQYLIKGFAVAGVALLALPAFAQKEKEAKKERDHQTIVINRSVADNEKTVIEINGDKVLINGKEAKDGDDVQVNVHKMKNDVRGLHLRGGVNGQNSWNFDMDNDGISLFSEDSNRAMLGIVTDEAEKGAEITTVNKASAAEKAGLKKGDIITKIGDKKVSDANDVSAAVKALKPGDKVAIVILRDGKEQSVTAELGKWKGLRATNFSINRAFDGFNGDFNIPNPPAPPAVGAFSFNNNRPRLGLSIQDTDDGKGVKVLEVDEDGAAAKAGIKEDDVITHLDEKAVNSADEVSKAVRESKDKISVRMQVLRAGKSQNIEVRIPRKLKTANL